MKNSTVSGEEDASAYSETERTSSEISLPMRDDEVAGWVRSLQLRGVPCPDTLKTKFSLLSEKGDSDHGRLSPVLHFLPECPVGQSVGQYPLRADRHYIVARVGLHQRRHPMPRSAVSVSEFYLGFSLPILSAAVFFRIVRLRHTMI